MRTLTLATALVACVLALGACGDDDDDSGNGGGGGGAAATETTGGEASGGGGGSRLALAADPNGAPKFDKTELDANAGKVTIAFTNSSPVPHAVEVEGNGVEEETSTFTEGEENLTVDLKPGTYRFYCPVDSHAQQGMEGTLTVK